MRSRNGFTLIEMLIVIAISAMLMSIAVTYSGAERDQIALSVEETKMSQFLLQTRALALATYNNTNSTGRTCGYGMLFDPAQNTYSIFAYTPQAVQACPSEKDLSWSSVGNGNNQSIYTQETWQVQPGSGITFTTSGGSPAIVLFYPPNPDTFIFNSQGQQLPQLSIDLTGAGGESAPQIIIDQAGQVNFSQ